MRHLTEEDLVLRYYGERSPGTDVEQHLRQLRHVLLGRGAGRDDVVDEGDRGRRGGATDDERPRLDRDRVRRREPQDPRRVGLDDGSREDDDRPEVERGGRAERDVGRGPRRELDRDPDRRRRLRLRRRGESDIEAVPSAVRK